METQDFSKKDIYFSADLFASVGGDGGTGEDLALLSLCNHSIISVREAIIQKLSWRFEFGKCLFLTLNSDLV